MNKFSLEGIENIIFDLGMVVIDLDLEATPKAFQKLFGKDYQKAFRELEERGHFQAYEKGEIDTDNFLKGLAYYLPAEKHSQLESAWNAMLGEIPESRFRILEKARDQFNTYCLSNTNELHIQFIYEYLKASWKIEKLDAYFEQVYLSHEIGMRKPDREIFEFVIRQNNLSPQNTLFIDDTAGHLKGAEKTGLRTYHLKAEEKLEDLFTDL